MAQMNKKQQKAIEKENKKLEERLQKLTDRTLTRMINRYAKEMDDAVSLIEQTHLSEYDLSAVDKQMDRLQSYRFDFLKKLVDEKNRRGNKKIALPQISLKKIIKSVITESRLEKFVARKGKEGIGRKIVLEGKKRFNDDFTEAMCSADLSVLSSYVLTDDKLKQHEDIVSDYIDEYKSNKDLNDKIAQWDQLYFEQMQNMIGYRNHLRAKETDRLLQACDGYYQDENNNLDMFNLLKKRELMRMII